MLIFVTRLVILIACTCTIVVGTWCLTDYSNRPGSQCNVAEDLNSVLAKTELSLELDLDHSRRSLVLFYHPHCPCTKATMRCLERIFTRFVHQPDLIAIAYCPGTKDASWIESPLTAAWRKVDQAKIVIDHDGRFCMRFGVCTSGHVVVYDDTGKLVFSGGITPGRGHEGHSRAASDLLDRINGITGEEIHWPVYGCPIIEPGCSP